MDIWSPDVFANAPAAFEPFRAAAAAFIGLPAWPALEDFNRLARSRALVTAAGLPLAFVSAAPKPRGRDRRERAPSYEARIHDFGEVPTRLGSWHDFFNVLAWAAFPRTKGAMNRRQILSAAGPGRSHEQNRLAMMDEGGIVETPARRWIVGHALGEAWVRGELGVFGLLLKVNFFGAGAPASCKSAGAARAAGGVGAAGGLDAGGGDGGLAALDAAIAEAIAGGALATGVRFPSYRLGDLA